MTPEIQSLISGYFDGVLSYEQGRQLEAWINSDPANAKHFADIAFLENRLQAELTAAEFSPDGDPLQGVPERHNLSRRPRDGGLPGWGRWFVIAAGLLVAVGIALRLGIDGSQPARACIATVSHTHNSRWQDGQTLQNGDRLSAGTLNLLQGFTRLSFDDGVEVTLEGPAEFELIAPGQTRLGHGLLTAHVPSGAEGFRVETPTSAVVDVGTSFGLQVGHDGGSDVLVFDGEVEVLSGDEDVQRLEEGQALQFTADGTVGASEFDTTNFEKLWPIASGIAGSSGGFRFVPPWPKQLRFVRSDESIFVAAEGYAVTLTAPLRVNLSIPGEYVTADTLTPKTLKTGERIRSFILHYHPREPKPPRLAGRVTGSISFDRPVLGMIVLHEELMASGRRFSGRAAGETHRRRQLELTGDASGDRVSLSADRKTIDVDLISPGRSSDLIRVIVKVEN